MNSQTLDDQSLLLADRDRPHLLDDGPVQLGLLPMNQNNNDKVKGTNSIIDTLNHQQFSPTLGDRVLMPAVSTHSTSEIVEDGPLLLGLLLANQNNNNNNANNNNNDTLTVTNVALELNSPVLKLRGGDLQSENGTLTSDQILFWKNYGYLVLPDALSQDVIAGLLQEVHRTAEALLSGGDQVKTHSSLTEEKSHISPVGRVLGTLNSNGLDKTIEPLQRIQRLGCGVHRRLPPSGAPFSTTSMWILSSPWGYKDPRISQSLVIVKAADVGPKVMPHQDGWSSFTNPPSCVTFWYALEDATLGNGCLAVAPGSHRTEPIRKRCLRHLNGKAEFAELATPLYAKVDGATDVSVPKRDENGELEFKKLEVKAGTLIMMHGNLMHSSEQNTTKTSRVAFNFAVVEGQHGWLDDNYLGPYDGESELEKFGV